MSKTKLNVNFHYGEQDFNNIMRRLIISKLKIYDEKEFWENNGDTELTAICQKYSKR